MKTVYTWNRHRINFKSTKSDESEFKEVSLRKCGCSNLWVNILYNGIRTVIDHFQNKI